MDYRKLIVEIIKESSNKDLIDLIKDYNTLFEMRNSRQYNLKTIFDIETKYSKEINMIDTIRVRVCTEKNVPIDKPFTVEDKVNALLNHLIAVMSIRYSKNYIDETIKNKIASEAEKSIYEILCYVRDQRKC